MVLDVVEGVGVVVELCAGGFFGFDELPESGGVWCVFGCVLEVAGSGFGAADFYEFCGHVFAVVFHACSDAGEVAVFDCVDEVSVGGVDFEEFVDGLAAAVDSGDEGLGHDDAGE